MQIIIKYTNAHARSIEYYLKRRYNSKANLNKLVRLAIAREVGNEAQKELDEINSTLTKDNP